MPIAALIVVLRRGLATLNVANSRIAVVATRAFGTMYCFWACAVYGLSPIIFPQYTVQILYWSNYVQLIALPLILVGTALMGVNIEKRAQQDHEMLISEMEQMKALIAQEREELCILRKLRDKLLPDG